MRRYPCWDYWHPAKLIIWGTKEYIFCSIFLHCYGSQVIYWFSILFNPFSLGCYGDNNWWCGCFGERRLLHGVCKWRATLNCSTLDCCTFFVSPKEERVQERRNDLSVLGWDLYNDIVNKVNNFSPHVYMLSKCLSLSSNIYEYHVKSMEIAGISCKTTFIWLIDY